MKVVIGIDPGTAACGYGIVHESDGRLRALGHGWWKTAAGERPELRLKTILAMPAEPTPSHAADALAVAICHLLGSPLLKATA